MSWIEFLYFPVQTPGNDIRSVVANSVGDRPFQGVDEGVDHFCAVNGKPITMVWLPNGTTAMNTIVGLLGGVLPAGSDPFATMMPPVLVTPDDCGGLLALPFLDDEAGDRQRRQAGRGRDRWSWGRRSRHRRLL